MEERRGNEVLYCKVPAEQNEWRINTEMNDKLILRYKASRIQPVRSIKWLSSFWMQPMRSWLSVGQFFYWHKVSRGDQTPVGMGSSGWSKEQQSTCHVEENFPISCLPLVQGLCRALACSQTADPRPGRYCSLPAIPTKGSRSGQYNCTRFLPC